MRITGSSFKVLNIDLLKAYMNSPYTYSRLQFHSPLSVYFKDFCSLQKSLCWCWDRFFFLFLQANAKFHSSFITLQKSPHAVHHDHADTRKWSLPGYPSTAEGTECTKNTRIHSTVTYVHTDIVLFCKMEKKNLFTKWKHWKWNDNSSRC